MGRERVKQAELLGRATMSGQNPGATPLPSLGAMQDAAGGLFKSIGSTLSPLGAKLGKSLSTGRQLLAERLGSADVTELPPE